MTHECEACGETFVTLTRLRLHDCPAAEDDTDGEDADATREWLADRHRRRNEERQRRGRRAASTLFKASLARARDGGADDALALLANYEQELDKAIDRDDDGDTYRDVFWTYYEPVTAVLDAVAREEGWPFLLDVVDAYDPDEEWALPLASEPVANAVARSVIRTRFTDGVAAVPGEALYYLATLPEYEEEGGDVAWEESTHFGWAIGHPDYPVGETIRKAAQWDLGWADAAAERAMHADQHAAVEVFVALLEEAGEDAPLVADRLVDFEGEPPWWEFPRYWDVRAEFDREFTFAFDEDVERRLRRAVEAAGLVDHLSASWTFEDLELSWGPPE